MIRLKYGDTKMLHKLSKFLGWIGNGFIAGVFVIWALLLLNPMLLDKYWDSQAMIHINQASEKELIALPGVGKTIAKRIVQARQEHRIQNEFDLKQVPGIGHQRCLSLRPYVLYRQ